MKFFIFLLLSPPPSLDEGEDDSTFGDGSIYDIQEGGDFCTAA